MPRQDPRGTAPPIVRAQPPELPTGGGAIRGIGEKFSANAATGTGSLAIPIATTPARGFGPDIALHYDSGAGNGPFGAGWRLSVPSISRKTDTQLPTYLDADASDTFVMSGAEDLVPIPGGRDGVTWYRPRVEGAFSRIERHVSGADIWWVSVSAANVRNTYGATPVARIADPSDQRRTFSWLLQRTEDALGNVVTFDYVAEDLANVAASPFEQHRLENTAPIANTYLKTINYGNEAPGDDSRCAFSIVFDYGDHDLAAPTPMRLPGTWPARRDAFSSYRAGFEIRTYRRCRRILVFHDLAELGFAPRLVRSVELTYDDDEALGHLIAVTQRGYGDDGQSLAMPALKLAYTQGIRDDTVRTIDVDTIGDLPGGVDGSRHQWIDLDAEGIPGVITDGDGALYFRRNLGAGQLAPAVALGLQPSSAALGRQQLMDLDGDGRLDLVEFGPPLPGFYERVPAGTGEGDWEPFRPFASHPEIAWADSDLRFIDLDGDGLEDLLIAKDDSFVWYPSLGHDGFGPPRVVPRPADEERGPAIVFSDSRHTIALADLSGDGLRDLVRVENGSICYWPNLGHGRFGAKVTMARAPTFDHPDQFEARRVLFADIDGTGTSDVLYAGRDGVRYWLNLAGNGWSEPHDVAALPAGHSAASVTAVDLLGSGTACLAWSSAVPGDTSIRYVDLIGGVKPHLLAEVDNQLGLTTRVAYAPSTRFYLADRAAGIHWKTHLPFPVHVVERVEVDDAIRKVRFVSEYAYRDGHFDGYEREFRGFGYVEHRDTEFDPAQLGIGLFADRTAPLNGEYQQPPVVTKTWFHTGLWLDDGPSGRIVVEAGLTPGESRDAYRALRGLTLRQEVYAEDGPLAAEPYLATEHSYEVRRVWPAAGEVPGVFVAHARETIEWHSERVTADPRIRHELVLEVDDYGHVRRSVAIGYPRQEPDARAEQRQLLATLTELDVANVVDRPGWYRHGVPLESRTFELVGLPAGDAPLPFDRVKPVADAAVAIAYDAQPPAGASKRLVERSRTQYYDSNAIPIPLAFGQIDARVLAYGSFGLAFTPSLVANLYGGRVNDAILLEGGYVALDDDPGNWWVPSGRSVPDPAKFYLPRTYLDPFGNATSLAYDSHLLVVASVTDARGNVTAAKTDYRVMAPVEVTDANGNRSRVAFDALGRVTSLWLGGKSGEGDSDEPTVKFDYAFYDPGTRRPSAAHSQARETHGVTTTRWQHVYSYTDGAGQVVMKKVQAEPGAAKQRQADGTCIDVDANPRWVGNGRTVLDNKGNPIKQYEPYFSVTFDYEDEDDLVCQGVTPIFHYDPIGRLTRTEHPDGSTARVELTPWRQTSYDGNDTIRDEGNVWYARALAGSPAERRAASVTRPHAGTPTVTLFDALGRAFSVTADNGGGDLHETRTTFDIEGNPLVVTDAMGRACMTRRFSLLGQTCHQVSIDAGERWSLADVLGQPLRRWDGRGQTIATTYDVLRRPVGVTVTPQDGSPILAEKTVWGEDAPAAVSNALGRAYQLFDGAGVTTSEAYDFKGNVLSSTRQLVSDYTRPPDWSGGPGLDREIFRITTAYDALNRPTQVTSPDGSVFLPGYNAAALLETVDVQIRGAASPTSVVSNIDYNEKAQRTRIVYGSAAATTYGYDPLTFRLSTLATIRVSDGRALQDLAYIYDPAGNVLQIGDAVQQPVFNGGRVVDGTALYTYEPVYRLSTATGREHAGGFAAPRTDVDIPVAPLPHPNDDRALIPYGETYQYDGVGNMQLISHGPPGGPAAWTSPMRYVAGTNRLDQTMMPNDQPRDAQWHGRYRYDAHGNMTSMPHLARIDWDWKDQMQRADLGGGGTVYFTYDGAGERARKVWEHGGTIDERIYVGGYEIYRQRKSGTLVLERQTLHVMDGVKRIAMVETRTVDTSQPSRTPAPVIRFQLGNHLGSAMLEIDATGALISYEEYHPYGTSAYRAQSAIEVSQKRYRYTGKERDEETSLEYHGARYYAPWLARWSACDPDYLVDGPNLYSFTTNNPIRFNDPNGHQTVTPEQRALLKSEKKRASSGNLEVCFKDPNRESLAAYRAAERQPRPMEVHPLTPQQIRDQQLAAAKKKLVDEHIQRNQTMPLYGVLAWNVPFMDPEAAITQAQAAETVGNFAASVAMVGEGARSPGPQVKGAPPIPETVPSRPSVPPASPKPKAATEPQVAPEPEASPAPAPPPAPTPPPPVTPVTTGRTRAGFMSWARTRILNTPNHPLRFLLSKGGHWLARTPGAPSANLPGVQAGHTTSRSSGAPERFAIEDAFRNQYDNWTGESKGVYFEKETIDISGVPVEKGTAILWEQHGLLPAGTVANAPKRQGW